ncbi:uncharacterized protein B0H64DRAFT_437665 [Chaetomium fimeti]|uniref:Uncharacterized protein n=1 Tax=Chaetomium fimeti TaxID=1854472 RepID=A0AAE0HRJ4_9PEZI|nr:hypothetical protein B0H64DRAFT_437665 [Chaetomium fimeti]
MNSDDLMSDPGQHANYVKPWAWNNKKYSDDYEAHKVRLQGQRFSSADYPDPLAPRSPHQRQYPKGTDPELESKLQELIAQVKAGVARAASAAT